MLDERTLLVVTAVGQPIMAILAMAVRRSHTRFAPGLAGWALGLALMSLGLLGWIVLDGPPNRWQLTLFNCTYLSGMGLLGYSLMLFLGRQPRVWRWCLGTASCLLLGYLLSASAEQTPWRIAVFMVFQSAVGLLGVQAVLRTPAERAGIGARVVVFSMAVLCLSGLLRLVFAVSGIASVGLLSGSPATAWLVGLVGLSQLIATLGMILMTGERLQRRLEQLASHDDLTGLLTRSGFQQFAEQVLAAARREVRWVGFLMIDVDHFKQINDRYGHEVGDRVLARVARVIRQQLREIDLTSRFGGEEFAVLLPTTDCAQTVHTAERLRRVVAGESIAVNGMALRITISIGAAAARADLADIEQLYRAADAELYRAKREGRNRVCAAEPCLETPAGAADWPADNRASPA